MNKIRVLLISTFLCGILMTSGCLGVFCSDGPPSQYNVTFDKPTTGIVFSNLSYSSNEHNQLSYTVENVSDEESLVACKYTGKKMATTNCSTIEI